MAFRIKGSPIISDERVVIGVNTAGINTALYVGNDILMDGGSGIATVKGFALGSGAGLVTFTSVTSI